MLQVIVITNNDGKNIFRGWGDTRQSGSLGSCPGIRRTTRLRVVAKPAR